MVSASSVSRRPKKVGKNNSRVGLLAVLSVGAVGAAVWFFVASESRFETQNPQFLSRRLAAEQGELWGQPAPWLPFPPPARICNARARGAIEKLIAATAPETSIRLADLESVLVMDPDCVPAMRMAVEAAARQGALSKLHGTLRGRAERETLNATAQIGAAIFSDYAGRSGDMLAFLSRAEMLRPDSIGLAATWADYHRFHTSPAANGKMLDYWKRELARGDDPRTLAHLIGFQAQIPDRTTALATCDRFYQAAPAYVGAYPARTCLKQAVELGDEAAVATYTARLQAGGAAPGCPHRWATYFGFMAGQAQARLEATRTDGQCSQLFPWLRGAALLSQGKQSVAMAALSGAADTPAWVHAAALALNGKRDEATGLLQQTNPPPGSGASLLSQLLATDLVETQGLVALFNPPFPTSMGGHRAQAACGYASRGIVEQSQQFLAQAVSAAPTDPFVLACQMRWFVLHNDHAAAAAVATRAEELATKHPYVLTELAHLRVVQNRCADALPLLQSARLGLPLEPTLYGEIARCLRSEGHASEADKWAQLNESDDDTWIWLAASGGVVAVLGLTTFMVARRRKSAARSK